MDQDLEELKPELENKKELSPAEELPEIEVIEDEEEAAVVSKPDVNDTQKPAQSAEAKALQNLARRVSDLSNKVDTGLSTQARDIDARISRIEKTEENEVLRNFKARYDQVKEALTKAASEGDGPGVSALTEKLTDMRIAWVNAEQQRRREVQQQQRREVQPPQQRQQQRVEPPTQEARAWVLRNRGWFGMRGFEEATYHARVIDAALEAEGYDKNSAEYFDELDKRVSRRYPDMVTQRSSQQRQSSTARRTPSPSAPVGRPSAGVSNNGMTKDGRLQFSRKELEVARTLGIADDPTRLREYHANLQARKRRAS